MIRGAKSVLVLALLCGCGGGDEAVGNGPPSAVQARSDDPRAVALRAAVEDGALERAKVLLEQVESRLGAEGPCLRARIAALENDLVGALRTLEEARRRWPGDPRPAATTVEIYATSGSFEAATDEYNRAVTIHGRGPELIRAQGVLALVTPGATESGLAMLEEARRVDPDLPFLEQPLAVARWMTGRQALARGELDRAEELARAALELRPGDPDARITLADALKGRGDFEGALPWLEALHAEGVAVTDELAQLHHAAATKAMLAGDRGAQVDHYLAARRYGFDDDELGHGAQVLGEEAEAAIDAGIAFERQAAVESDDAARAAALEGAEARYREALLYRPDSVEAGHRLATLLFGAERFREAALAWESAAARARTGGQAPPVPLELNAAMAWERAERPDLARQRVEEFLDANPESRWVDRAFEQLARLEAADGD